MNNTPQGKTIEDNAADDILLVDQGRVDIKGRDIIPMKFGK